MPTATELHNEIQNDPQGLGYKTAGGDWKADEDIAALINDPTLGDTVWRTGVPMPDIYGEVVWSELLSQTTNQILAFMLITQTDALNADSQNIRDAFADIFPSGSTTTANLTDLVQKQGSRAEVLWGDGTTISPGEVGRAANA